MPEITDDDLDARLRDAGARWREALPATPTPTVARDGVEIAPEPAPRRRARTWIAAASGAALVAAAVVIGVAVTRGDGNGSPQPAGQAELTGTSWVLVATPTGAAAGSDVALDFTRHGQVSGRDGCNYFNGRVDIQATRLVFGNLAQTAMACSGLQAPAELIHRVLAGHVTWAITNGRLVVTKTGVGSLTYAAKPAPARSTDPKDLVGVTWDLSGVERDLGNAASGSGSSDTSAIRLTFDGKGGYRVQARPCQTETGHVSLSPGAMEFSARVIDYGLCPTSAPQDVRDDITAINQVLVGSASWSVTDGMLTMTKGGTKLIFTDHPTSDRAAPPAELTANPWRLRRITSPKFTQNVPAGVRITLTVTRDGAIQILDGVNSETGTATITADRIVAGDLITTTVGCGGGPPCVRASLIDDLFRNPITWVVGGDELILRGGEVTLHYVRA